MTARHPARRDPTEPAAPGRGVARWSPAALGWGLWRLAWLMARVAWSLVWPGVAVVIAWWWAGPWAALLAAGAWFLLRRAHRPRPGWSGALVRRPR